MKVWVIAQREAGTVHRVFAIELFVGEHSDSSSGIHGSVTYTPDRVAISTLPKSNYAQHMLMQRMNLPLSELPALTSVAPPGARRP
jgi:hypothetical protein